MVFEEIAAPFPEVRFLRRDVGKVGGLLQSSTGRLRTALPELAWLWVAHDEAALSRYRPLVANPGSDKKAIVGIARCLGVLLRRLSCRGKSYRAAA
jgi:hypothetical protein